MPSPVLHSFLLALLLLASACAALGVLLPNAHWVSRWVVPASGVVLMLTGAGWILPEVADNFGWPGAMLLTISALSLLWVIDHYVYPLCPSCAHSHDHHSCVTRLHGFAVPVLTAVALHNLFDGWMMALGESGAYHGHALSAGIFAHKLPECIAIGVILRAALGSRSTAVLLAVGAQLFMLVGALLQPVTSSWLSAGSIAVLLAFSGATFLYLGFHSLHGEWKRRTATGAVRIHSH